MSVEFGERGVDLRPYIRAVTARWWLLVAGVVVGALVGFVVLHGRGQRYKATAEIYVGETSFASDSPTNLALVSQFVTTELAIRGVARELHVNPGRLRGNVTTSLVLGPVASKSGSASSALMDVTVTSSNAKVSTGAADGLARLAAGLLDRYPRQQFSQTSASLAAWRTLSKQTTARLAVNRRLRQQLESNARPGGPSEVGLTRAYSESIGTELQQQNLLRQLITQARVQEILDRNFSARVTRNSTALSLGLPGPSTGLLIGGLIGLILGVFSALVWQAQPRARVVV